MDTRQHAPAPATVTGWRVHLVFATVFCFVFTFTTTALAVCAGLPLVAAGTDASPGQVCWLVAVWWASAAVTVPVAARRITGPPLVVLGICAGVHVLCASFAATLAGVAGIAVLWILAAVAAGCAVPVIVCLSSRLPESRTAGLGVLKLATATAMTAGVPLTVAVSWWGPHPDWQRLFYVLAGLGVVSLGLTVAALRPQAATGAVAPGAAGAPPPQQSPSAVPDGAHRLRLWMAASLAVGACAAGILVTTATTVAPLAGGGDPGAVVVFALVGTTGLAGAAAGGLPVVTAGRDAALSKAVLCLVAELLVFAAAWPLAPVGVLPVVGAVCAIGATGGVIIRVFRDLSADGGGRWPAETTGAAGHRALSLAGVAAAAGAVAGGMLLDSGHLWLVPLAPALLSLLSLVLLRAGRATGQAGRSGQTPGAQACPPRSGSRRRPPEGADRTGAPGAAAGRARPVLRGLLRRRADRGGATDRHRDGTAPDRDGPGGRAAARQDRRA